jgi:alpha-L-rhamnosidase/Glycosyl hydrolases family 2, sugar binding domain
MKRSILPFALLVIFAVQAIECFAQSGSDEKSAAQTAQLYQGFLDPPHDFSLMPFWFWNGKMQGPVIQQEIREMVDQHVYGAFLHARDGLQTPYLSEDWWKAIGAGLEQSKTSGFEFNFVDEYDWPSGEVRNVWMAGNHQSEVLAKRPDLRMKTLAYESKIVIGSQTIDLAIDTDSQAIVASRWLGKDQIDASTLTLLDSAGKSGHIQWSAPEGQWVITQFSLKPAMGFDGGFVDLLNPDTTNLFFDLVYGEYYRRFPTYVDSTIRYAFSDHEGDYGYRIAWTPKLFSQFQQQTGYDLRKSLPLLIYSGGDVTTKVRTDYLATITDIYGKTFWQGITKSASELGLGRTGHAWEESLQWSAALQGSLFTVERGLNPVGVDSLEDFGRQPLNFKVAQSVADFEGRRFACENQGVQGTNSYLDMEAIRKGTNGIGAWGVNLFIPHAFDYDAGRANYPPDWLHQPYWPYFHEYADYTRRISYMNSDSHHVTNVLLYYPITTMWSETEPLFSGKTNYQEIGKPVAWKNNTVLINDYYTRIILELSNHHWDYNIADDQYFESARVEGSELVIGPQRFRAVVLPPITTLSRATLTKLQEFHKAGGIILGIRTLPTASPDTGENDSVIKAGIASIFAPQAENSFYIDNSVDELISTLDAHVPKDVQIITGPAQHLFFQHRIKLQTDYYWVVNDTDRKRINQVHFAAKGIPEKWDARTSNSEPLLYTNGASGTDVRLNLDPWDAFYVVFRPSNGSTQDAELVATNAETLDTVSRQDNVISVHVTGPSSSAATFVELRNGDGTYKGTIPRVAAQPITLNGPWQFHPQPERISVPYARTGEATEAKGKSLGWTAADFDDTDWPQMWLNEEQATIRHWQMIGPFSNTDNDGFSKAYPPEQEFDAHKTYDGLSGPVGWQEYNGNEPYLALDNWNIWMKTEGGNSSDSGYVVKFNPQLLTDGDSWIVSYAHTYLYSPQDQHAQFIVAADNWTSIWLNHKQIFAQLRTPFWYELNDNWADRVPVNLHKGWNEVLMKVGKGRGTSSGFYGFTFRVADDKGATLPQVIASTSPSAAANSKAANETERWYRMEVPPGCVGIVPPSLHNSYRMLLNGQELHPKNDNLIDIRTNLNGEKNTLVIIARKDDPLVTPVQFVTGPTPFSLKSWTQTGLANFSGTAVYTKTFALPDNFRDKRVILDLGRVSSVADVFVNGKPAGAAVWRPYQVDISKLIHPGENEIKILVTNTEANARAVGTWHRILPSIDLSGMVGPVQVIPYIDQVLTLHPSEPDKSQR